MATGWRLFLPERAKKLWAAKCRPLSIDQTKKQAVSSMENQSINYEGAEETLRHSWEVHRQAFGPILEPAFPADR